MNGILKDFDKIENNYLKSIEKQNFNEHVICSAIDEANTRVSRYSLHYFVIKSTSSGIYSLYICSSKAPRSTCMELGSYDYWSVCNKIEEEMKRVFNNDITYGTIISMANKTRQIESRTELDDSAFYALLHKKTYKGFMNRTHPDTTNVSNSGEFVINKYLRIVFSNTGECKIQEIEPLHILLYENV